MTKDTILTLFIIGLFILAPFLAAYIDYQMDRMKQMINRKLAPHGLRLKNRG